MKYFFSKTFSLVFLNLYFSRTNVRCIYLKVDKFLRGLIFADQKIARIIFCVSTDFRIITKIAKTAKVYPLKLVFLLLFSDETLFWEIVKLLLKIPNYTCFSYQCIYTLFFISIRENSVEALTCLANISFSALNYA